MDLDKITHKQYQQIVYDWNATSSSYPRNKIIREFFEEHALKTPDRTAIFFEGWRLSFRELNEASNKLAHFIRNHAQYINRSSLADVLIVIHLQRIPPIIPPITKSIKTR